MGDFVPSVIVGRDGQTIDNQFSHDSVTGGIMNDYYDGAFNTQNIGANDYSELDVDVTAEQNLIDQILEGTGANVSLSEYMRDNPGMNAEDYFKYMSEHSDEWAEKYLDYLSEKQSLAENNAYTANREDTAYQRLVEDLRRAGLNPAMMYGSSASPQASNSLGYLKQNEGATSRSVNSFSKLKNLLIGFLTYELYRKLDTTGEIFDDTKKFTSALGDLAKLFVTFF